MLSYLKLLKTRAWARLASFFCLVILLSLILFIVGQKKRHSQIPVIESSDPAVGLPGDVLTITGQHFGSVRGDSYVEISSSRVTGSHCISWQDTEIQLYIPENVQDGLVTVTTGYGTSSPSFFASKANIPVAVRQDPKTTLPVILAVSPETALVGDSITITGTNFGVERGESRVYFTANRQSVSSDEQVIDTALLGSGYEYWSDTEIRVRVPDGADSGKIFVETARGKSRSALISLNFPAGKKTYSIMRTYVVQTFADLKNESNGILPPVTLYLPRPAVSTMQPSVSLSNVAPVPLISDDMENIIFQSKEMAGKGSVQDFSATHVISIFEVAGNLRLSKAEPYSERSKLRYKSYMVQDSVVPSASASVDALVKEVVGKEKNPARAARLCYDYITTSYKVRPKVRRGNVSPLDSITGKSGDAYDLTMLFTAMCRKAGVVAVPVAGIICEGPNTVHPHWWTEIFLEHYGWLPVDVPLGTGLRYESFPLNEDREAVRNYYFGNMDSQHIAFSRGWTDIRISLTAKKTVQRPRSWALQSVWEEVIGDNANYSSLWGEPVIVGIY